MYYIVLTILFTIVIASFTLNLFYKTEAEIKSSDCTEKIMQDTSNLEEDEKKEKTLKSAQEESVLCENESNVSLTTKENSSAIQYSESDLSTSINKEEKGDIKTIRDHNDVSKSKDLISSSFVKNSVDFFSKNISKDLAQCDCGTKKSSDKKDAVKKVSHISNKIKSEIPIPLPRRNFDNSF